jgi:2,3-bisphosphoglycerate-dependent phosphoglycerate mutase
MGNAGRARAGGERVRQPTAGPPPPVERLAGQHADGLLVIGSHGTFVARLLAGLGLPVDCPCCCDMPMPATTGFDSG